MLIYPFFSISFSISARVLGAHRAASTSSRGGKVATGLAAGAPSKGGLGRSPSLASPPPPAYSSNGTGATAAASGKRPPPPPPTKPKPGAVAKDYVVALYDYAATADGDLSFKAGDRIEVTERTASTEDWWTGVLNGQKGVFPG